jgi:hypothetical protein
MKATRCILFFILMPLTLFARTTVGVIGDSISVPYPVLPVDSYHAILAKEFDWFIFNASLGGSYSETLMPRLVRVIEEGKPDFIIIALGVNDALLNRDIDQVYSEFVAAINYVRMFHISLVIGTVDVRGLGWYGPVYSSQFRKLYNRLQESYPDVIYFDFMTHQMTTDNSYFSSQDEGGRFHPNEKGHLEIAERLKNALMNSTIPFVETKME